MRLFLVLVLACSAAVGRSQAPRQLDRFQEVFAWKQVAYNIYGNYINEDRVRAVEDNQNSRTRRQSGLVFHDDDSDERNWNQRPTTSTTTEPQYGPSVSTTTASPSDGAGSFFIQYNNLPMGVERVENRLFITMPRRRYGILSTLNYLDLTRDSNSRSPGLRPYPSLREGRSLTSVYRTRADSCGRLWMVDTGLLEIPDNPQQVQPPAIVIYDLNTDRQILRYNLKSTDIIAANTPTGLASITVDIQNGDCSNAYAYIPDLATYGLIVFSLRERDSWRLSHNFFHFNPTTGNLNIAGQSFQWNDGIFSVALSPPGRDSCRTAYFHPMVGIDEFSVSTCVLRNKTASAGSNFWQAFSRVGDRCLNCQSTMHDYHAVSSVLFFADIGRDAISCWKTSSPLNPANMAILAQDSVRLSYPSDLHVTGDEVWVMANSLPTWAYSRLDTDSYNFYIYKGNVQDLIAGTVCSSTGRPLPALGTRTSASEDEGNKEDTNDTANDDSDTNNLKMP